MKALKIALVTTLLFCCSCVSMDTGDLIRTGRQHGLTLTSNPAPANSTPVALVATQMDGFYLFGHLPIAPISMTQCVEHLVRQVQAVEADGVACIEFAFRPASFLSFSVFPIPDWTATIAIRGMAYRRAK